MFVCIKNCGFSKGDIVELKSTVNNYNILINIKTKEQNVFTKQEMDEYFIDKESYDKLNREIEKYLYEVNNGLRFEKSIVVPIKASDDNTYVIKEISNSNYNYDLDNNENEHNDKYNNKTSEADNSFKIDLYMYNKIITNSISKKEAYDLIRRTHWCSKLLACLKLSIERGDNIGISYCLTAISSEAKKLNKNMENMEDLSQ